MAVACVVVSAVPIGYALEGWGWGAAAAPDTHRPDMRRRFHRCRSSRWPEAGQEPCWLLQTPIWQGPAAEQFGAMPALQVPLTQSSVPVQAFPSLHSAWVVQTGMNPSFEKTLSKSVPEYAGDDDVHG